MNGFVLCFFCTLVVASPSSISHRHDELDEIDLEESVNDYYDSLLEFFRGLKKKILKKNMDNFVDYDYMSDMPAEKPSSADFNGTWRFLNASLDDTALVKVERESDLDLEEGINRSKELRLNTIMNMILGLRGGNNSIEARSNLNGTLPPTKALQEIFENNKDLIPSASSVSSYTQKVQSFYASCDVPRQTDEDAWTDNSSMNLYFDLRYPTPSEDTAISIVSAKLRLYKLSQVNVSSFDSPVARSKTDKNILNLNPYGLLSRGGTTAALDDDRLIRVSVHWYTRGLKRNRVKRKLLDSQMFSVIGEEWMEFNIRTAVRTWREVGRNYGLMVTVEDEDGNLLSADQYVHPMNCSQLSGNIRPLPSIIYDAAQQYLKHQQQNSGNQTGRNERNISEEMNAFPYPTYPYPMVDLCTMEVPLSEASTYPELLFPKRMSIASMLNNTSQSIMVMKSDVFNNANSTGRTTFFTNVGLGTPIMSGHNRANQTILEGLKKELMKNQNIEVPRFRHSRKHETIAQNEPI